MSPHQDTYPNWGEVYFEHLKNGVIQEEKSRPTKEERIFDKVYNHIEGKRTLRDEYNLINEKKSTLPKACRDYVVSLFDNLEKVNE